MKVYRTKKGLSDMKGLLIVAFSIVAVASLAEPQGPSTAMPIVRSRNGKVLTQEELRKREEARLAIKESSGGFIYDTRSAQGFIAIIDAQKKVPGEHIRKHAKRIEAALAIPVKCVDFSSHVGFSNLDVAIAAATGSVSVVVTECDALPALISIPEKKCVLVNVAALSIDSPNSEKIKERTLKEIARAVCFCFVINYSGSQGSVMDPVFSLEELDKMLVDNVSVAQKMHIEKSSAQFFGMRQYKRTTYAKACQEGWAPPPADKYQQAIWDKMHEMPTKPLTIEPEK